MGRGEVRVEVNPAVLPLKPLRIAERGELKELRIVSVAGGLPLDIARRQFERARARLKEAGFEADGDFRTVPSSGKGTYVFILAGFENIRAGFTSLGAIKKSAETVGDEAADGFLGYMGNQGALDAHLSDQVLMVMALAKGESVITTAEFSGHLKTNAHVIEKFLPVRFSMEERETSFVRVEGCGFGKPFYKKFPSRVLNP